mmetsp:Transcript_63730/g.137037  ORF Transcript_63730/g.137037 Transcript_63730/m.137037 type:complete len:215 (-) Transcript_63730:1061-1705(-)
MARRRSLAQGRRCQVVRLHEDLPLALERQGRHGRRAVFRVSVAQRRGVEHNNAATGAGRHLRRTSGAVRHRRGNPGKLRRRGSCHRHLSLAAAAAAWIQLAFRLRLRGVVRLRNGVSRQQLHLVLGARAWQNAPPGLRRLNILLVVWSARAKRWRSSKPTKSNTRSPHDARVDRIGDERLLRLGNWQAVVAPLLQPLRQHTSRLRQHHDRHYAD